MSEPIIRARELTKTFEIGKLAVQALRGVDLDVTEGEFLALVGPSGSGKTTLLNLIGALDVPTSGELIVVGQRISDLSRHQRAELRLSSIGFVFQAYNLVPVLTALENVEFVLELQGVTAERRIRAKQILSELGLVDLADRRPSELSGGQQQRVAVARAVAARPRLVLADEPTANLDGENAETLMHLMRDLKDKHHTTFIFSTHDPRVVAHALRVVTLVDGRIARDEPKLGEAPHPISPLRHNDTRTGREVDARMRPGVTSIVLLLILSTGTRASSQEPTNPVSSPATPIADSALRLRTSFKATGLISHAPDDPVLYPEQNSATSYWRLRLEPEWLATPKVRVGAAYEQRLRLYPRSAGFVGTAILPPDTKAPYRISQLDWQIAASPGLMWRQEIDRAWATVRLPRTELTVGRQAVGWGRGVLFGAVDLFSPFSPTEVDREWRRGVDAIRADVKLADRVSIDGVGAFGETTDESAFAARLRGYAGRADVEVVGGWRARDVFAGLTSSAAVGDAELHGELAVFRTPEPLPTAEAGDDDRTTVKAVVGGSYRFALGSGLLVFAEYHYSGFGAKRAEDILQLLQNPEFQERFLRGDTQILLRHAIAVLGGYEFTPELRLDGQWLQSPVDGSGLVTSSATITLGDKLSFLVSGYLPYGRPPEGPMLKSEYGVAARSLLLQIRIYV